MFRILIGLHVMLVLKVLDLGTMKNVLLAPVSPPVDLARGRETQIGQIFRTLGLSGALLLEPENQRNGESERVIYPHVDRI